MYHLQGGLQESQSLDMAGRTTVQLLPAVVANSVGFGESKAEAEARGQQLPESDGFMNIPEGADEELPFN